MLSYVVETAIVDSSSREATFQTPGSFLSLRSSLPVASCAALATTAPCDECPPWLTLTRKYRAQTKWGWDQVRCSCV